MTENQPKIHWDHSIRYSPRITFAMMKQSQVDNIIAARNKQIGFGKNTQGYKNYIANVPKEVRPPFEPRTPDPSQDISKRAWDYKLREWRRKLHRWDDIPVSNAVEEKKKDVWVNDKSFEKCIDVFQMDEEL